MFFTYVVLKPAFLENMNFIDSDSNWTRQRYELAILRPFLAIFKMAIFQNTLETHNPVKKLNCFLNFSLIQFLNKLLSELAFPLLKSDDAYDFVINFIE